jgi:anti-sigma-K factor RskA
MHGYDLSDVEQRNQAAAEYVLGILTAQDKARVEALMAVSHDMQKEIESWREHLDVFNRNLKPIAPPTNIWKNINKETKPEKEVWSWRSLAGFSLALMLSVGIFLQWPQDGKIYSVPLIANENQQPGWVMNTSMSKKQLVVESQYPVDMPENTYYELWLMEKGHEPMSLGFLPASGKKVIPFEKSWADRILDCEILVTMEGPKGAPNGYSMGPVSDTAKWKQVSF